jgi:hypothetical protein
MCIRNVLVAFPIANFFRNIRIELVAIPIANYCKYTQISWSLLPLRIIAGVLGMNWSHFPFWTLTISYILLSVRLEIANSPNMIKVKKHVVAMAMDGQWIVFLLIRLRFSSIGDSQQSKKGKQRQSYISRPFSSRTSH